MTVTSLFIPHGGGPLPLMDDPSHAAMNRFLRQYPKTIARPDAIVVISAHWEEDVISVTSAESPSLLFDYYNFPPETYEYQYPAAGNPQLAGGICRKLTEAGIEARLDSERGFDHGVFVPLLMMYPLADIPCVQISLSSSLDAMLHIRIGQALRELDYENLLVLGSGFSFHNLRVLMSKNDDVIDPRNQAFEDWLAHSCSDAELTEAERESRLVNWESAPHADYCHPRSEHLLPLHVCYGIGGRPAKQVFQDKVAGVLASAYQW